MKSPHRRTKLDKVDRIILRELQSNARITNVELARRAGISAPPCLRRVRALEEAGLIKGYSAQLAAGDLGFEVTMFAAVGLQSQAETDLQEFAERIAENPLVREAFIVTGESDFLLKCVARDIHGMQSLVTELTSLPNVANVRTRLVLNIAKYEPGVPLEIG